MFKAVKNEYGNAGANAAVENSIAKRSQDEEANSPQTRFQSVQSVLPANSHRLPLRLCSIDTSITLTLLP